MFNIFRRKESKLNIKANALADKLEIAKQQLISDLEKNGMEFLITKMGSNDEYSDLILERRNIDLSYKSEDSEKFSNYKKYIYCCLASICSNTNDKDLFNFLIDKIQQEDDESTRISILRGFKTLRKVQVII